MILPAFIVIPLLTSVLVVLSAKRRVGLASGLSIAAAGALVALSILGFLAARGGPLVYHMSGWRAPIGIPLVLDAFSALMLIMVGVIALASLVFSREYIRNLDGEGRFYALTMAMIGGMNGVILAGDFFNLFVFLEIALFAAFALVAYGGRAHEFEAAFKYAILAAISSSLILIAIAVLYGAVSALSMASVAAAVPGLDPVAVHWIGGLFLAGFGLKAAAMPFHAWLPDAHSSAPAPISALLSGVLIKALGLYALIRIFYNVLGAPPLFIQAFLVLGTVSVILGVVLAVGQWDLKRLLAYHSISQIGYVLIGMGLNTTLGMVGAVFHLLNHAVFKSLLFYNAGALETALGTRDLREMGDVSRLLPTTARTSMVASLSISGIPPFNGFFSKLVIIIAALQAEQSAVAVIAGAGSLLTLASFMKVQRYGLRGDRTVTALRDRVSAGMNLSMASLAVLCVVTSLLIVPGIREVTLEPAVRAIMDKAAMWLAVLGG